MPAIDRKILPAPVGRIYASAVIVGWARAMAASSGRNFVTLIETDGLKSDTMAITQQGSSR